LETCVRIPAVASFADTAPSPAAPVSRERGEVPDAYKWSLDDIFTTWEAWEVSCRQLESGIDRYPAMQGTLGRGPDRLLAALRATDELGQLAYRVYYYAALKHDEDQRANDVGARKQQVQVLLARWAQATSWFNPELLRVPVETVRGWMQAHPDLAVYRFAIEDLYRQQAHVLDEDGERLLSLANRFEATPHDTYEALSTADVKWPSITLSSGETVQVTYGQYRAILETNRVQADRAAAFRAMHETFAQHANTYAALYHGVLQRDLFASRARHYHSTLEAALFGNDIPTAVVENLIATAKAHAEPLRRYCRFRKRALGLERYHLYDHTLPVVQFDRRYAYDEVTALIVESVAPLGSDYADRVRRAFAGRWIDVFESPGKRSGAYSAPVYGVHPYMLLNWNDTLDAVFTLAHEMGHSMHTLYSHEAQPFVYSNYTIFVAEVPSTLSEALLLDYLLARTDDPLERIVLMQHAIDEIVSTFFTQVLFADFELAAHRCVEQGQPVTSDALGDLYMETLRTFYGDALDYDDLARFTWARIPHFYGSPYYVYQYATCYASTARLVKQLTAGTPEARCAAVGRFLDLLRAGGSDHPMTLLARAGVDLREPATVMAVIDQLDALVTRVESEFAALGR
jgi:oligoendopeptidase F